MERNQIVRDEMKREKFPEFCVPEELIQRCYAENGLAEYRSEFMRDRDRLMYAAAFRRLAGKTQIYTVGGDDHKKNRLTHTLEVAQIARTIALALELDSNLAEAIALGHDFGHTPFGHAGEEMLHEIMTPQSKYVKHSPFYQNSSSDIRERFERENGDRKDHLEALFGFKHNIQSVRVAALMEDSYRREDNENMGLNLTNFTLYGMMSHSTLKYREKPDTPLNYQKRFQGQMKMKGYEADAWSFEAYVVKLADDIAQWHHDLEDALREGVLPIEKIRDTITHAMDGALSIEDQQKLQAWPEGSADRRHLAELSHIVVNTLVNDLVETSRSNFQKLKDEMEKKGVTMVRLFTETDAERGMPGLDTQPKDVIAFSEQIHTDEFKGFIREAIHHSKNVARMNAKGQYIIRKLFEAYYDHPQQLPDGYILHLMADMSEGQISVDAIRKDGVGQARVDFEEKMKNPTIYVQCLLMRRICDHIAAMTDHYAIEEYNNLYG